MRGTLVLWLWLAGCREDDRSPHGLPPGTSWSSTTSHAPSTRAGAGVRRIMQRLDGDAARLDNEHLQEAVAELVGLGPAAIPELIDELRAPPSMWQGAIDRRYPIVRALKVHGAAARDAIPLLTPLLGGSERHLDQPQPEGSTNKVAIIEGSALRNSAAEALGAMGEIALPALIEVMRGTDPVARRLAVAALESSPPGMFEGLDVATADDLLGALLDTLPEIWEAQLTAIRAIESIPRLPRPVAAKAVPRLRALEAEADSYVRPAIAAALARLR